MNSCIIMCCISSPAQSIEPQHSPLCAVALSQVNVGKNRYANISACKSPVQIHGNIRVYTMLGMVDSEVVANILHSYIQVYGLTYAV